MGLLKAFGKYTAYFHDGDVFAILQNPDQTVFYMESAQIPPEEMLDDLVLTNFSTLRGRLHLEGVKCIYADDVAVSQIKKQYDIGDIYDFEIKENSMRILITWQTRPFINRKNTDMIEYKIQAEKIYWENLPIRNNPIRKPIEDYQDYFLHGKIFRIEQEINEIRLAIESLPIPKEAGKFCDLTEANTLKKELIFSWPRSLKINKHSCITIEPIIGKGEILKISIGHHHAKLDIHWSHIASGNPGTSPTMNIEVECGAIDVRDISDNSL